MNYVDMEMGAISAEPICATCVRARPAVFPREVVDCHVKAAQELERKRAQGAAPTPNPLGPALVEVCARTSAEIL